jgi:tetratricopeptide (TPR) repeat protein
LIEQEDRTGLLLMANFQVEISRRYASEKKWKKSVKCARDALCICEKLGKDSDENIASVLAELGTIYYKRRDFKKAEHFFNRSLSMYYEIDDDRSLGLTYLLPWMAKIYQRQGRFEEAEQFLKQSILMYRNILSRDGIVNLNFIQGFANTLNNIGILYYHQQKLDRAIPFLKESLSIERKYLTCNTEELIDSFKNLAMIHSLQRDFKASAELLERSLYLERHLFKISKNPSRLIDNLKNLNSVYSLLGNREKAGHSKKEVMFWELELRKEKYSFSIMRKLIDRIATSLVGLKSMLKIDFW